MAIGSPSEPWSEVTAYNIVCKPARCKYYLVSAAFVNGRTILVKRRVLGRTNLLQRKCAMACSAAGSLSRGKGEGATKEKCVHGLCSNKIGGAAWGLGSESGRLTPFLSLLSGERRQTFFGEWRWVVAAYISM